MPCFLYFLINSHCSSKRSMVLLGAKETRDHFLVSSVFIWVGRVSKGFLVNKVHFLSSDSFSWVSPGTTYWERKQIGKSRENWCVLLVKLSESFECGGR